MLGSSIMFAPVTTAGATSVYVYLPAGFWRSIHSTSVIIQSTGQSFSVDAPLGCPAAFISVTPSNECTNDLLKEFINTVPKILQACSEITWSRI